MNNQGSENTRYRPEFEEHVLGVQQYMCGSDARRNRRYLRWKYYENPYGEYDARSLESSSESSLLRGGFIGLFSSDWAFSQRWTRTARKWVAVSWLASTGGA